VSHHFDLAGEMAEARKALSPSDRAILAHYSVPEAMIERGMIGVVMADLSSGEALWATEGHSRLFVTPCLFIFEAETPEWERAPFEGYPLDILAWRPESPDWYFRIGNATWLGAYPPQFLDPEPVRVHDTPLSWLRSGGVGICPLSHNPAERQQLLLNIHIIAAADMEHAMELRRLLERPMRIPKIVIEGGSEDVGGAAA
jgi:hypothetical protein